MASEPKEMERRRMTTMMMMMMGWRIDYVRPGYLLAFRSPGHPQVHCQARRQRSGHDRPGRVHHLFQPFQVGLRYRSRSCRRCGRWIGRGRRRAAGERQRKRRRGGRRGAIETGKGEKREREREKVYRRWFVNHPIDEYSPLVFPFLAASGQPVYQEEDAIVRRIASTLRTSLGR